MIFNAIFCFASMVALDYVWARYTKNVASGDRLRAASYASLIMVFNGVVIISYTGNPWMLIPAIAGAFVGTYLGVERK